MAENSIHQSRKRSFQHNQPFATKVRFWKVTQKYRPDLTMSLRSRIAVSVALNFSCYDLSIDIWISDSFGPNDDDA